MDRSGTSTPSLESSSESCKVVLEGVGGSVQTTSTNGNPIDSSFNSNCQVEVGRNTHQVSCRVTDFVFSRRESFVSSSYTGRRRRLSVDNGHLRWMTGPLTWRVTLCFGRLCSRVVTPYSILRTLKEIGLWVPPSLGRVFGWVIHRCWS